METKYPKSESPYKWSTTQDQSLLPLPESRKSQKGYLNHKPVTNTKSAH